MTVRDLEGRIAEGTRLGADDHGVGPVAASKDRKGGLRITSLVMYQDTMSDHFYPISQLPRRNGRGIGNGNEKDKGNKNETGKESREGDFAFEELFFTVPDLECERGYVQYDRREKKVKKAKKSVAPMAFRFFIVPELEKLASYHREGQDPRVMGVQIETWEEQGLKLRRFLK